MKALPGFPWDFGVHDRGCHDLVHLPGRCRYACRYPCREPCRSPSSLWIALATPPVSAGVSLRAGGDSQCFDKVRDKVRDKVFRLRRTGCDNWMEAGLPAQFPMKTRGGSG